MALRWRKRIDEAIRCKMEAKGFRLVDFFIYMKELSPEVDMVVQLKQGSRYSKVFFTHIFINVGVIHKELAELEAILNLPHKPTSPPPHWWHTTMQSWLILKNLNYSLVPDSSFHLTSSSSPEELERVTDAVVETVVKIGLPLAKRFDSIQSLIQEFEFPTDRQMRGECLYFKQPLAYLLNGQLDKAQQSLMDFERKLREEDPPQHKYFQPFEKSLSIELARRKADLS